MLSLISKRWPMPAIEAEPCGRSGKREDALGAFARAYLNYNDIF
jgi:hypothetical protein